MFKLIIGLCIGGAVLIAAAIVLIILLIGGNPIVGEWYSEDLDETIEFNNDGTVDISSPYADFEGEYEYNKGKGEGVITIDGDDYDFVVDKDELEVDDIGIYTREGTKAPAKSSSIIGVWYCEELDETIEFAKDGYVEINTPDEYYFGEYTYNANKGEGMITIDGDDYEFEVDGDELEVSGDVYAKEGAGSSGEAFDTGSADDDKSAVFGDQTGIVGVWYETTGFGGIVELYANGTFEMETMGMTFSGTYDFDEGAGEGEMTLDFMGETEAMDMYFEDGIFYLDGMEYTREYVEQMDLGDVMEDFDMEDVS